jgi:hypothetical protein
MLSSPGRGNRAPRAARREPLEQDARTRGEEKGEGGELLWSAATPGGGQICRHRRGEGREGGARLGGDGAPRCCCKQRHASEAPIETMKKIMDETSYSIEGGFYKI